MIGGDAFINKYLKRYSKREDVDDFGLRKEISYLPAFAMAAVDDIKNAIYQPMVDVSRIGGSASYRDATAGKKGGVDLCGSSMNYFIGQKILLELLGMRKVGVYVDMPNFTAATKLDVVTQKIRPYIYMYSAEDICNWIVDYSDNEQEYRALLLTEQYNTYDPKYGLPMGHAKRMRYMFYLDGALCCCLFNMDGEAIDPYGNKTEYMDVLKLRKIPFVSFCISRSILTEIARYQIGLLNLASSDVNNAFRSNFPLYTEQRDQRAESTNLRGNEAKGQAKDKTLDLGPLKGRAYPVGAERPGFIAPPSDPLKISMALRDQMKAEIRQLANLNVSALAPAAAASAESKQMDNQGLEAGLSYIGLELERGENLIAQHWAMYESETAPATVHYPTRYELKSDSERRDEVDHMAKTIPQIPSLTGRRETCKVMARVLLQHKVSVESMRRIEGEIDSVDILSVDPKTLVADIEAGILAKKYAAIARGYPKDSVEIAETEHVERAKSIALAQAEANPVSDPAARGVPDLSTDPKAGSKEKKEARKENPAGVRGEGK